MLTDVIEQVALIHGQILHGGTGLPIAGRVSLVALEGSIYYRVFKNGRFVVSGKVDRLFPQLSAQPYTLTLRIRAESTQFHAGYAEALQSVAIPQGSSFQMPIALPLLDSTFYFPADPVNVRGGVVEAGDAEVGIDGATVEILQGNVAIASTVTNSEGRYRLNNVTLTAPTVIQCSAPGFDSVTRSLLVDFSRFVHREDFRLPLSN